MLQEKVVTFIAARQFGTQTYSYASSNEDTCSESSSRKMMGKTGQNFGVGSGKSQQQVWRDLKRKKQRCESTCCTIDGYLSSVECGIREWTDWASVFFFCCYSVAVRSTDEMTSKDTLAASILCKFTHSRWVAVGHHFLAIGTCLRIKNILSELLSFHISPSQLLDSLEARPNVRVFRLFFGFAGKHRHLHGIVQRSSCLSRWYCERRFRL